MTYGLENASLLRVDAPSGASISGTTTYASGADIAVDVFVDDPSGSIKWGDAGLIKDATAVMFVAISEVPAGVAIERDCLVVVQMNDEATAATYRVLVVRTRKLADVVDHLEIFLKGQ